MPLGTLIVAIDLDQTMFDSKRDGNPDKILTGKWVEMLHLIKSAAAKADVKIVFQIVTAKNIVDDIIQYVALEMGEFFPIYTTPTDTRSCANQEKTKFTISQYGKLLQCDVENSKNDQVIAENIDSQFPSIHMVKTPRSLEEIPNKEPVLRRISEFFHTDVANIIMIDDHIPLLDILRAKGFTTVSAAEICRDVEGSTEDISEVQKRTASKLMPELTRVVDTRIQAIVAHHSIASPQNDQSQNRSVAQNATPIFTSAANNNRLAAPPAGLGLFPNSSLGNDGSVTSIAAAGLAK
jgi:hypothetical protein